MEKLKQLLKKLFDIDLYNTVVSIENGIDIIPKAATLVRDLDLKDIPFKDEDFNKIFDHPNYKEFKELIDKFKHIKDYKLPDKN